jgi:hypothetical protein
MKRFNLFYEDICRQDHDFMSIMTFEFQLIMFFVDRI